MCVAAIAWAAHPAWRLVAIGNRDEYHQRPTAPLARWDDAPILGGRDLQAGGTWLGVSEGRFGLVTNLRVSGYPRADLTSRGALVSDWLQAREPDGIAGMNPFNLWLADTDRLRFVSNHPDIHHVELAHGIHGLSNGARGDRWFKTARLEAALENWLASDHDPADLFAALADPVSQSGDPEDAFSSVFIRHPDYGTRCSTVVLIGRDGTGWISERRFGADGAATGDTALDFTWPV
ncbi:NRDE family protein [Novosphingobium sp.]|uniref:NRDE family protein n=1 Tax=Novosphingobium sp. TaxID=1874826 RepID=UPI00260131BA|nr:NRDE family protein [Novosphingobium sp.]